MSKTLYFALSNNDIAFSNDIVRVYYFVTGNAIDPEDHNKVRRAASTMSAVTKVLSNPSVEFLVKHRHIVSAVRLYRQLNDCTLSEAKEAVDKIIEALHKE